MAVHPLENARWGFESNCFVCEPRNERGILPSFHDDERFNAEAHVLDAKGRQCVRAACSLVVLSPAKAVDALGTEASGDSARYVR